MAGEANAEPREVRLARNEARAREENERRAAWFHGHERVAFVCECADPGCEQLVSLDRECYEALRAAPTRFAVAVGHDEPGIERVVAREEHHYIVEKIGIAAEIAKEAVETPNGRWPQGMAPESR